MVSSGSSGEQKESTAQLFSIVDAAVCVYVYVFAQTVVMILNKTDFGELVNTRALFLKLYAGRTAV